MNKNDMRLTERLLTDILNNDAKHCYLGEFEHLQPTEKGQEFCDYAGVCPYQNKTSNGTLCNFNERYQKYLDKKYSNVHTNSKGIIFYSELKVLKK